MGSGTPNTDRAPMIRLTLTGSSRRPRHRPRHPALSVVIPLAPDFPVTDGDCDDSGVSDVSGASGIPDRQDVCALPAPGAPCADDAERAIRSVLGQSLRTLEVLLARLGADPARALAVGDGSNDVEMIEWAGAGVVMGSAPQWVRDRGDILTEPVWRDGCAAVLDALIERVRHP